MSARNPRDRGSGGLYQDSRGLWTAVVELPPDPVTQKRRRKVIRSKQYAVAQKKLKAITHELTARGDIITGTLTLKEWLDYWNRNVNRQLKPKSQREYESTSRLYIEPKLGRYPLDKLKPEHVLNLHQWIMSTKADGGLGLSPSTAAKAHRTLRKALNDAVRLEKVQRNVASLVPPPANSVPEQPSLTLEQAIHFLTVHAERFWVSRYAVGLTTGARQGEVLGLQVEHVDIRRDRDGRPLSASLELAWSLQRIPWQHGCNPDGEPTCGGKRGADCPDRWQEIPSNHEGGRVHNGLWLLRPKTTGSWRVVEVPAFIAEILDRVIGERESGFAFTTDGEHPMSLEQDWETWNEWLEEAGLPRMGIHAQRHTANSLLAFFGADERTRMDMLGHTTTRINRSYTHDRGRQIQARAAEKMGALAFNWEPADMPGVAA